MARIENAKGRMDGGYGRLFGNRKLGFLMSRVQAAVISSGNELERIIKDKVSLIDNVDAFLQQQDIISDGVFVTNSSEVKKCKSLKCDGKDVAVPDFIIFEKRDQMQCHLVELKDGDSFDTKKSAGELQAMQSFFNQNAQHLPSNVQFHFCCFNQDSRAEIVKGFKNKIDSEKAMTGKEFCELLEIDYKSIIDKRKEDAPENMTYFLSELVKIEEIKERLCTMIRTRTSVDSR